MELCAKRTDRSKMEIMNLFFNAVVQVLVFSLIPFIWWVVTARRKENFFLWIGLVKVKKNYSIIVLVIALFCVVSWVMQKFIVPCLLPPGATVQQSYTGQGAAAILPILLFGMIQTGLSEEILFRGFILKRLSKKLGFQRANFLQALLFGTIHGIGFFMLTTPFKAIIIVLITGFLGWIFGYLNEKKCDGSIIPSYLCHGIGNCFISLLSAFAVL